MKRIIGYICIIISILILCSCNNENVDKNKADLPYKTFTFTHYSSGGTPEEYTAIILFEESVSSFTSYQIAFQSCTCRDSLTNYNSICYVELLNTKPSAELASIRSISFGDNKGLYGDSNPNYYRHDYTEKYMDEHFIQCLVHATKSEFDEWKGYGTQLSCIDADAVTGASVSTGNITSMLKSLFAYHAEHYYNQAK